MQTILDKRIDYKMLILNFGAVLDTTWCPNKNLAPEPNYLRADAVEL